ncbi:MAG: ATP-binding protein, partial [Cyanobacteria bacterium P01_D01_bin.1]
FFRVENRVHTLEGTGLGLSIVKNIMDKHNSQINLVGEVGVGTTFWFDLPVYELADSRLESDESETSELEESEGQEPRTKEYKTSEDGIKTIAGMKVTIDSKPTPSSVS